MERFYSSCKTVYNRRRGRHGIGSALFDFVSPFLLFACPPSQKIISTFQGFAALHVLGDNQEPQEISMGAVGQKSTEVGISIDALGSLDNDSDYDSEAVDVPIERHSDDE